MICLNPLKTPVKPSLLRQDGTYLSLTGKSPEEIIHHWGACSWTTPFAYSVFRVIDTKRMVLLGQYYHPFYKRGQKAQPRIRIGYTKNNMDSIDYYINKGLITKTDVPEPEALFNKTMPLMIKNTEIRYLLQIIDWDFDEDAVRYENKLVKYYEVGLYDYLGISNPDDPILTAQEIALVPTEKLLSLCYCPEAFSGWNLTTPITGRRFLVTKRQFDEFDEFDKSDDIAEVEDYHNGSDADTDTDTDTTDKNSDTTDKNKEKMLIVETVEDNLVGHISSIMCNNDYSLYLKDGESRIVYGIGDTDICPYVFVPKERDNDDYSFSESYYQKTWGRNTKWCVIL